MFPGDREEVISIDSGYVKFQMPIKSAREDVGNDFLSLELKNRSALEERKYTK